MSIRALYNCTKRLVEGGSNNGAITLSGWLGSCSKVVSTTPFLQKIIGAGSISGNTDVAAYAPHRNPDEVPGPPSTDRPGEDAPNVPWIAFLRSRFNPA